jgi:membrane protease YdiL (CAAX protease family)
MHALREVLRVFSLVTAATLLASYAGTFPIMDEYVSVVVGALFLWTAVHMSQRQPDGVQRYGLALGGLLEAPERAPSGLLGSVRDLVLAMLHAAPSGLRELGVALLVAAVVFPPFALGFWFWHGPTRPFALGLPSDLGSYALTQWLIVAVPEEALFRGYVQSRLAEGLDRARRVLGAELSLPAWLLQAALFALLHFAVEPYPARLAVFFPALLFGWLRARRGGIGASSVFHALCNLLSDVLARSWL